MKIKRKKREVSGSVASRGVSITAKLAFAIVLSVIIAVGMLLAIVYVQMSNTLLEKSEEMLQTTTDKTLQETRAWINKTLTMLESQRDTIEYENMDIPVMQEYIRHTVGQNDAYPAGLYVALTDGSLYHASFVPGPDFDATAKSWYQDGLRSEDFILGDVYFDEDSQSYVVGASGALKYNDGVVRGVAAADVYLDSISEIVSDVKIEDTGGIFLVDTRTDTIIGHRDQSIAGKKLGDAKGSVYSYAGEQISANKTGLSLFDNTYIQVSRIPDSDWMVVAYVSKSEVLSELHKLTVSMILVSLLAVAAILLLVIIQVRRIIGKPVNKLIEVATKIADGDLNQTIDYQSKDELGVLAHDFNLVTLRLRDYVIYINEIADKLREIAGGNLAFTLKNAYTGEFAKIKTSLEEISVALNDTMGQMSAASRDVAAGASMVSSGAMTLSQGSTEQSAEVEALVGHVSAVSDSIHKIAQGAQKANDLSQQVKNGLLESNEKMENLTTVIQKISDSSMEINNIVKTIEDIAFQTNILALNASVEAARAGSLGKGFAVVADEVRALASKSSEAAKETSSLLSETVNSMDEGVTAAKDTAGSLMAVADYADEMTGLIDGIAGYTKQQEVNAENIANGIDQISVVVKDNAATAEASAAASEELSSQAAILKELVSKFRLKE